MKKHISLIILICLIFLYENSSIYWLHNLGGWAYLISIIYFAVFLFAIGYVIYSLVKCFQIKFKDNKLTILTLLLLTVMILPFLIPRGVFSKKLFYKGELFVAYLDGVAGNNGWLTLYGNNTYEYTYGTELLKGKYQIKGDTIFFDNPKGGGVYNFDYATLWKDKSSLSFGKDSITYSYMTVVKNELIK